MQGVILFAAQKFFREIKFLKEVHWGASIRG